MNLNEAYSYVKSKSADIKKLLDVGDKEAIALFKAYNEFWKDQKNPAKQTEFVKVASEFMRRDLTITEREELARRHGYYVDEKRPVIRSVVPK